MSAVAIENVTKTFRQHVAVDNLRLQVPRGSIYGFIGPNGSGKTTTLRMIMRILYPDRGDIRVLDEAADSERSRRSILDRVAYLPEERGLYKQMKVREI
ncbi:MAG: ATP-binding cassette domain-containing protein, partial [Gemmataceae bacterium]